MALLDGPALDKLMIASSGVRQSDVYPFNIDWIRNLGTFEFESQITFFVGENGSGKSTFLEALAEKIGFGRGGSKNFASLHDGSEQQSDTKKTQRLFTALMAKEG